jgi:hypothetical protein
MNSTRFNYHYPLAIIISLLLVQCGTEGEMGPDPSMDGVQSLVWNTAGITRLDSSSGTVMAPQIAIEPNGGSGVAVWLEQRDENPFDDIPPITHLYARRFSAGAWATTDTGLGSSGCPADGQSENTDEDGICLIDTGSALYSAGVPQISMDNAGAAVVVWEQSDGTDCSTATGAQPCTRIYVRPFNGAAWSAAASLISLTGNAPAVDPDIAVEPDGGGTAIAAFTQWDGSLWRIRVNRLTGGIGSGSWGQTGTGYIDGGTYPNETARIGMGGSGDATVAWIRLIQGTCYLNVFTGDEGAGGWGFNPNFPQPTITCRDDRVYVNRTSGGGTTWTGPTDISPGRLISASCWDDTSTNACVSFGQLSIARAATTSFVTFKAFEWGVSAPRIGWGDLNQDAEVYEGIAIWASRVTDAGFTNTALATYTASAGSTNCPATNPVDSLGTNRIMNCDLDAPTVTVEPDSGNTAFVAYERYNASVWDIVAHRCSGGPPCSWGGGGTVIDAGAAEAHAPKMAASDVGDGVTVWVQKDGGGNYRIYSNSFSVGSGSWGAAGIIDNNTGSENQYYNPVVAMDGPGSALALFVGYRNSNGSTRLYGITGP